MDTPTPTPPSHAERRLAMIRRLAQLGMEIAEALAAQAIHQAQPNEQTPEAAPDATLAFTRMARCLRQTLALEVRLEQEAKSPTAAPSHAEATRARRRTAEIRRKVERCIETYSDARQTENLLLDLDERLQDEEFQSSLCTRKLEEIVTTLCYDLGLIGTDKLTDAYLETWIANDDARLAAPSPPRAPTLAPTPPPSG